MNAIAVIAIAICLFWTWFAIIQNIVRRAKRRDARRARQNRCSEIPHHERTGCDWGSSNSDRLVRSR